MIITSSRLNTKGWNANNLISFKSPYVDGSYYTDREYIDAVNNKDYGNVDCSTFVDRYGFFTYVFTSAAENHAAEVNRCIAGLKAEEARAAKAHAEKLREQEEERKRLQIELQKAREASLQKERAIQEAMKKQENRGLARCELQKHLTDELAEEIVKPFAVDRLNKKDGWVTEVPNGVLLHSSSSQKNEQVVKALGEQILQDKFDSNFYTISLKNNNYDKLEEDLSKIKANAAAEYSETGQRTIIFIPNFDQIAFEYNNPNYNPSLNGFLKAFFLNCADNGCTIFATAQNINEIEEAFIVNKERFAVNINL